MKRMLLLVLLCLAGCAAEPPAAPRAEALHWSVETADGRFLGSATLLGGDRLLTNRHVVGALEALVVAQDGRRLPVRRISRAAALDAAMLEVPGVSGPVALGPLPEPGAPLMVAGARGGRRQSGTGVADAPRYGAVFAAARLPAAPGYSGGPVLDGDGRLIGIVAAAVEPDAVSALALSHGGTGRPATPRLVLYLPIATVLQALPLSP